MVDGGYVAVKSKLRPIRETKVIVYIYGFNLYFGLREQGWRKYMWLDLVRFAQGLLFDGQHLVATKYFTSRVASHVAKQKRQSTYLDALDTLKGLSIYYGQYQAQEQQCQKCGFKFLQPNEKKTDVNIATQMMTDAFQDNCDTLILVTADSDLTGPIEAIRQLFSDKAVMVAFPPKRFSADLQKVASGCLYLRENKFIGKLLSPTVPGKDGFILECPDKWKATP